LLVFLNLLQLVLYIAMLALAGQGLLYILSGQKRDSNLFYQLFVLLNKPWNALARLISPKAVAPRHHGFVAFFVVAALYMAVTLAKIEHCISIDMVGCR
jgi:ABC-type iron transport system FetAB permease component